MNANIISTNIRIVTPTVEQLTTLVSDREASDLILKHKMSEYAIPIYKELVSSWFSIHQQESLFMVLFQDDFGETLGFGGVWEINRPAASVELYVDFPYFDPILTLSGLNIVAEECFKQFYISSAITWLPLQEQLINTFKGSKWELQATLPEKYIINNQLTDHGLFKCEPDYSHIIKT